MEQALTFAWTNFVRLFFLFCPFFVLNMFLSLTEGGTPDEKHDVAIRVTCFVAAVGAVVYFAGNGFLNLFGLNIEGFRIGTGILLLILAKDLALGSDTPTAKTKPKNIRDIVIVPLGIPIIMGPACISPIIIIGADAMSNPDMSWFTVIFGFCGFLLAMASLGTILYFSDTLERIFSKGIIRIFSKLSGIILIAMAANMIAQGFFTYLDNSSVGAKLLEALTR